MHPSMARRHPTLIIMLLLVSMKRADSVRMNTERRSADSSDPGALGSPGESPYWEYVLREFLFKTISPPPLANNILYKELLEAPFYRGPFPAPGRSDDAETAGVLSRGDVYRLAQGGWIICQEGCADCEICNVQKTVVVPAVKWILRRIERHVPFPSSKRRDLQLTVSPQADGSFHMKNLSPGSYVYVIPNSAALAGLSYTLIHKNVRNGYSMTYPFTAAISPERNNPGDVSPRRTEPDVEEAVTRGPGSDDEVSRTETRLAMTSTSIPETHSVPGRKREREVFQGEENPREIDGPEDDEEPGLRHFDPTESSTPLTLFYPAVHEIDADCETGKNTRLILGRDQFGEKHIVHVVPAGDLDAGIDKDSVHPAAPFLHEKSAHSHPLGIEYEGRPLYRKIFRRVMDSLSAHKNAIENFLFSSKPEAQFGLGRSPISAARIFDDGEEAGLNNDEISAAGGVDEGESSDWKSAADYGEEIIAPSEETSSISTTTNFRTEEDEGPTESDHGPAQVTQESNNRLQNFDERNSERTLSDEVVEPGDNPGTLILKEVAKSVVNHPDTLLGFNSASDTSLRHDSVRSILDGTAGRTESSNGREESRRHV